MRAILELCIIASNEAEMIQGHKLLAREATERPDDAQVLLQYGDALCAWQGKHEEGLQCFQKAAALGSKDPALWMYMASALRRLGQFEAALVALGQISQETHYKGKCAELQGEVSGALGRWKSARQSFQEAHARMPTSISIEAKLALVEMECGENSTGLQRMRRAIRRAEAQAMAHEDAVPYLCAAELHAQIRQWPEALRLAEAGIELDAGLLPLHELILKAAVATERLPRAAEAAEQITRLKPEPRSFLRHVAILCRIGNHQAAREAIARVLEQFPQDDAVQAAGRELGIGAPAMA